MTDVSRFSHEARRRETRRYRLLARAFLGTSRVAHEIGGEMSTNERHAAAYVAYAVSILLSSAVGPLNEAAQAAYTEAPTQSP